MNKICYYILMATPNPSPNTNTNTNSNTTTTECNHPPSKVILTPEGEYVCNACGVILTPDQAAERGRYLQSEVKGYIDPRGKTNPWLHGLGSVIPKSYYAKVAIRRDAYGDHDSKFANVIVDLELERFGQELMDAFHAYSKSKGDYPTSVYLSIKRVCKKYGLSLSDDKVKEVIERTFNAKVQYVSEVLLNNYCKVAKHLGSKQSSRLLRKVIL
jgi:hypothetical protein